MRWWRALFALLGVIRGRDNGGMHRDTGSGAYRGHADLSSADLEAPMRVWLPRLRRGWISLVSAPLQAGIAVTWNRPTDPVEAFGDLTFRSGFSTSAYSGEV
jgi:hypothetical protein